MKKLLSLLSVLTISGTAVPTTIAASPYQKQEKLNSEINYQQANNLKRFKREFNDDRNEIEYHPGQIFTSETNQIWGSFKPNFWEQITILKNEKNNNSNAFADNLTDWCFNGVWMTSSIEYREIIKKFSLAIYNNFNKINDTWKNGDKKHRIRIGFNYNDFSYISSNIRSDERSYNNAYLPDLFDVITNPQLGNLNNNNDSTILAAVKDKNPNLDINQVIVKNKENDSAWIHVKNNQNVYKQWSWKKVYFTIRQSSNDIIIINKKDLNSTIINTNLNNIDNNSDLTILNELNYLNPKLDISQLEVTEKNYISATIREKINGTRYFGKKKIFYSLENQKNKIINLNNLIKKAIFFKFRDDNSNLIFEEIKNINTDNLIYSNVTATKSIEPVYSKENKSICFGTATLFHNLPEKQNMKTPSCKYTKETTINTQITTGLSKEETNSKTTDMKHNWSFELGINVNGEAGVWPFSKVSTEINTKIGSGGEYGSSETKTLSNKFDFSDSKTKEFKETSEVELPSQEISVNPNQKIKVTASLDEVLAEVTLNLKQDIYGEINATIILNDNSTYNFNFSIKEAMKKLQKFGILPEEIIINNNDSITFNGKASRLLKQGFDGNISFYEVN